MILPILFFGGFGLIAAMIFAYSQLCDVPRSAIPDLNVMLISLPAFFIWIPLGLLLGNCVLYLVAPLRRNSEKYVAEEEEAGFAESQKALLKAFSVTAIVCIPLIILGFVL